jgi:hypothetical protein
VADCFDKAWLSDYFDKLCVSKADEQFTEFLQLRELSLARALAGL